MVEESSNMEVVILGVDGDEESERVEGNSCKDDDEGESEVDLSVDSDAIDSDVEWRILEESCDIEVVAVVLYGDKDNG